MLNQFNDFKMFDAKRFSSTLQNHLWNFSGQKLPSLYPNDVIDFHHENWQLNDNDFRTCSRLNVKAGLLDIERLISLSSINL